MRIFQVNCFCTNIKDSGNPAAVIVDCEDLSSNEKQLIAKEIDFPVTTFISDIDNSSPVLEFYYPAAQMPLCLHGTIAAAHWIFNNDESRDDVQLIFNRRYNKQLLSPIIVNHTHSGYFLVEVFKELISHPDFDYIKLAKAFLKLPDHSPLIFDLELLFEIASIGSPKFFIPLKINDHLDNIIPHIPAITDWCIEQQINGIYVYTRDKSNRNIFYARGFNPKTGCIEDAATGVAVGALSCGLKQNMTVFQGNSIGYPSKLEVAYIDDGFSRVGGLCVSKNELFLK